MDRLRILVTNDDGFEARGLKILCDRLSQVADIKVVAPSKNKSACAHSMTLNMPLRLKKISNNYYKLDDGTPTDCIFLGLQKLYGKDNLPDLVVSGINIGSNMGEDITYSGTVAGAMEAVLQNVPAISISQVFNKIEDNDQINRWDYSLACDIIVDIVKQISKNSFPLGKRKFLNINIPQITSKELRGIKITKAGHRVFGNDFKEYKDPKGDEFLWIGLHPLLWEKDNSMMCDFEAVDNNYVSITPIHIDLTSYSDIDILNKWIKK